MTGDPRRSIREADCHRLTPSEGTPTVEESTATGFEIYIVHMSMKLEFTDDELRELTLALEEQRHGLMIELAGADLRDFKDRLRAQLQKVETLAARLESSVAQAPAG